MKQVKLWSIVCKMSSSSSFLACNSRLYRLYVDHILHRYRFWAISTASGSVRLWDLRSKLRYANMYPLPLIKTKRFCSFISLGLANYVDWLYLCILCVYYMCIFCIFYIVLL